MNQIIIKGARQHNLKDLEVVIPKGKFVVVCGVSGSGKSSLVFDTIYVEACRKYVEAFSLQKGHRASMVPQPDVDYIEGLCPAVAVRGVNLRNPRSTVGTLTGVHDYLRVLFATVGTPFCPECGKKIEPKALTKITEELLLHKGKKAMVLAPVRGEQVLQRVQQAGFLRVRIDGRVEELPVELKRECKQIQVVVDRVFLKEENRGRLIDSLQTAAEVGGGIVQVLLDGEQLDFSTSFVCSRCGKEFGRIKPSFFSFNLPEGACRICTGLGELDGRVCPACEGARLKRESLSVKIEGLSISALCKMEIGECARFLLRLDGKDGMPSKLLSLIKRRLDALLELNLSYISLDRALPTLSYGEAQRVQLAAHMCAGLGGMLYLVEEPSAGLHEQGARKVVKVLKRLRNEGNTIIVVEHVPWMIKEADYIIELGPGAGREGGYLIHQGDVACLPPSSPTAEALRGLELKESARAKTEEYIWIKGASMHNLKNVDVKIPRGLITCITGPSGAGKSTLLQLIFMTFKQKSPHGCREYHGEVKDVLFMSQTPIGKSPRSCPATYIGAMDDIRDFFSSMKEARLRGYKAERFSFNNPEGRCRVCAGEGVVRVRMHLLEDIHTLCKECGGKRFSKETLRVKYRGKDIGDVLNATVKEACALFDRIPSIKKKLVSLMDVGLGYLMLGQPLQTLSAGEAQRLRLSKALLKRGSGLLYLFDEPTFGLHQSEVKSLLRMLRSLCKKDGTVVVATHDSLLQRGADYIIELGPGAGREGGYLIHQGYRR